MQSLSHFQALQDRTTVKVICLSATINLYLHLCNVLMHIMQAREIGQVEMKIGGDRKADNLHSSSVLECLEMRERLHDLDWRGPV